MLETVRAYGAERLADTGETATLDAAHASYYLQLAEAIEPRLRTGEQLEGLARLQAEHANLLTALRWAVDVGKTDVAIRLSAALMWYWILQGRRQESFAVVKDVVDQPGYDLPAERATVLAAYAMYLSDCGRPAAGQRAMARARRLARRTDRTQHPLLALLEPIVALFAKDLDRCRRELDRLLLTADPWTHAAALMCRGFLNDNDGDTTGARRDLAAARDAFVAIGDRWGLSMSTRGVAAGRSVDGDHADAVAIYREALAYLEALGSDDDVPELLAQIGFELARAGDDDGARREHLRALELADRGGRPEVAAWAKCGLGDLAKRAGDLAEARRQYEEALGVTLPRDFTEQVQAFVHAGLASVAIRQRDIDIARVHLHEAVEQAISSVDMPVVAMSANVAANLALADDDPERAGVLVGAAVRLRGTVDHGDLDASLARARAQHLLGDARYEEAYARGAALSGDEALAYVRSAVADREAPAPPR